MKFKPRVLKGRRGPFGPIKKKFIFKDGVIELYSIGWLAYMCNRAQRSIRRWEADQILPRPIFDLSDGRRWYSASELIGYTKIVRESGLRPGKKCLKAMRIRMNEFREKLKQMFLLYPEKVQAELPQKFSITDLMRRHKEAYWKQQAHKLLNEISK